MDDFDFYERIRNGFLVLICPVWLPFWFVGWSIEKLYDLKDTMSWRKK